MNVKSILAVVFAIWLTMGCGNNTPEPINNAGDIDRDDITNHQNTFAHTSADANKTAADIANHNYINSFQMIFNPIPAGKLAMGSNPSHEPYRHSDETKHHVTISEPFYMQTTEVTQEQWASVIQQAENKGILNVGELNKTPSYFTGCIHCPVEQVSWNDVQTFIRALNQLGEGTYHLPTEAQWEYAARAGSEASFENGAVTADSCQPDPNLDTMGWYCHNSDRITHKVAQKPPNPWGLYDMLGNVWEWCQDWYGHYPPGPLTDPTGPPQGSMRVLRGGCWGSLAWYCRSAERNSDLPDLRHGCFGFRLVLSRPD